MRFIVTVVLFLVTMLVTGQENKVVGEVPFAESFGHDSCTFSTTGRNPYLVLEPGYQLMLQGIDEGDTVVLVITVLNETKRVGEILTRIVEERESKNRALVDISRNFYAICQASGHVFYFGEEVDIYKDGKVKSHDGSWIAGGMNRAGVIMPGSAEAGSWYCQEIAPCVAMDQAEIISASEILKTPAGEFRQCLKVRETTPLEPSSVEYKLHAPDIGLIKDGPLVLVHYGFVKKKD